MLDRDVVDNRLIAVGATPIRIIHLVLTCACHLAHPLPTIDRRGFYLFDDQQSYQAISGRSTLIGHI